MTSPETGNGEQKWQVLKEKVIIDDSKLTGERGNH